MKNIIWATLPQHILLFAVVKWLYIKRDRVVTVGFFYFKLSLNIYQQRLKTTRSCNILNGSVQGVNSGRGFSAAQKFNSLLLTSI